MRLSIPCFFGVIFIFFMNHHDLDEGPLVVDAILAIVTGYSIGSIPTAFLAVKWSDGRDIRHEGTGNVGAMNSFDVTGKKWLGIAIGLVDFLKGLLPVVIMIALGKDYAIQASAGLAAVIGHDFPVWLRFHGGRGLSTSLGAMVLLGWLYAMLWCIFWFGAYKFRRDIHAGNLIATVAAPVVFSLLPAGVIEWSPWSRTSAVDVIAVGIAIAVLILIKHTDVIGAMLGTKDISLKQEREE